MVLFKLPWVCLCSILKESCSFISVLFFFFFVVGVIFHSANNSLMGKLVSFNSACCWSAFASYYVMMKLINHKCWSEDEKDEEVGKY